MELRSLSSIVNNILDKDLNFTFLTCMNILFFHDFGCIDTIIGMNDYGI